MSEPAGCRFCDAPATAVCSRCDQPYCSVHGGALCDRCSDPDRAVPSRTGLLTVLTMLAVGAVAGLVLLVHPVRLPGEHRAAPAGAGAAAQRGQSQPAPSATVSGAASVTPTPAEQRYTIKAGDTLAVIATRFGTTVEKIRAANPGIDDAALQIGQEIVIPGGS